MSAASASALGGYRSGTGYLQGIRRHIDQAAVEALKGLVVIPQGLAEVFDAGRSRPVIGNLNLLRCCVACTGRGDPSRAL